MASNPGEATVQSGRFVCPGEDLGTKKVFLFTKYVIPFECLWCLHKLLPTQSQMNVKGCLPVQSHLTFQSSDKAIHQPKPSRTLYW